MDMNNINEIIGNLSKDDMNSLQEMANSLFGDKGPQPSQNSNENKSENSNPNPADLFSGISPEMLLKISQMMSMMNKKSESADFISALKPYLSQKRQKRADEAMQFMRLLEILPLLQQFGDSNGG